MKTYDIDKVKAGDIIPVYCDKEGCKKFIQVTVIYPSTMQCFHSQSQQSFDMRNQIYLCKQHNK